MIKRVDRYIGQAALLGIIAVWSGLILLAIMFNFLGELRSTSAGYTAIDAFWFVLMTTPRTAYELFPVCALMGALVGVGGLAAGNELVVFRTSGVSRLRLAGAALAGTLFVTLPVMVMAEWLAPASEQQARVFRLSELIGQYVIGGPRGMWLRDGDSIVNIRQPIVAIEEGRQTVQFRDLTVYEFGENGSLQRVTRAGGATHDGTRWQLSNVFHLGFSQDTVARDFVGEAPWETRFEPELVDAAVSRPAYMSVRTLWKQIQYLGENGLDDRIYRSNFVAKLFFPITVVVLVLAGMPFVFGSARNQKIGVRLFIGMTLGIVFTILNRATQNLGDAYGFSPLLTVTLPSVLLGVAAVLILRRSV